MPSTRKKNAKEKRCRQSDVMSHIENLDVMLGSDSRKETGSQLSENEENTDRWSNERQNNTNRIGVDFRTLLDTNSAGNSEIISETVRLLVKLPVNFPPK